MIKRIALIATICATITCMAQIPEADGLNAGKAFTVAPSALLNLLDGNVRLDMLDYYRAGVDRQSVNSVGGPCQILEETPYSLKFIGATDTEYQLFVLNPKSLTPIIGIIETIQTPIPESMVSLYSRMWKPLEGLMPRASLSDWLTDAGKKYINDIERQLPFVMSECVFDPETSTLTATNTMDSYFAQDDKPQALSWLKDKLTYKWDGKKFKLVK